DSMRAPQGLRRNNEATGEIILDRRTAFPAPGRTAFRTGIAGGNGYRGDEPARGADPRAGRERGDPAGALAGGAGECADLIRAVGDPPAGECEPRLHPDAGVGLQWRVDPDHSGFAAVRPGPVAPTGRASGVSGEPDPDRRAGGAGRPLQRPSVRAGARLHGLAEWVP